MMEERKLQKEHQKCNKTLREAKTRQQEHTEVYNSKSQQMETLKSELETLNNRKTALENEINLAKNKNNKVKRRNQKTTICNRE